MIINENYLKISDKHTVNVKRMDFDDAYDYRISLYDEFWENFKDSDIILSFWFRPEAPPKEERKLDIHFGTSPWHKLGTLVYPANTNEFKFYEFKLETKNMKDSYRIDHFFIRFNNVDLGKTFYLKELKLEKGDKATPYIPHENSLETAKRPYFIGGGYVQRGLSNLVSTLSNLLLGRRLWREN